MCCIMDTVLGILNPTHFGMGHAIPSAESEQLALEKDDHMPCANDGCVGVINDIQEGE